MTPQEAIAILAANREALVARGVRHAALFGSIARGEGRPDSDLDILIELDPSAKIGIFQYAGIRRFIEGLFAVPTDVVDRRSLRAHVRPSAENDAIYAF
jgi:predicted nucleotidyltransferase